RLATTLRAASTTSRAAWSSAKTALSTCTPSPRGLSRSLIPSTSHIRHRPHNAGYGCVVADRSRTGLDPHKVTIHSTDALTHHSFAFVGVPQHLNSVLAGRDVRYDNTDFALPVAACLAVPFDPSPRCENLSHAR